jgi:hypothetical protein
MVPFCQMRHKRQQNRSIFAKARLFLNHFGVGVKKGMKVAAEAFQGLMRQNISVLPTNIIIEQKLYNLVVRE